MGKSRIDSLLIMAHKKRKVPKLIVSKNAFSRFLEKNYGYTELRQFTGTGKFSSRLNSVFLAKDAEGNDVFIKACRYGDMSENEYRCGLELWKQSPEHFAKPLAYHSGKRFSFCCSEYVPGRDLRTILESGEPLSDAQRAEIVEGMYEIFQALQRANMAHRDVALKNMLLHNGRLVLIDCQLSTKRDCKTPISFFDSPLKVCLWRWGDVPGKNLLEWDDTVSILQGVRAIGSGPAYQERYDFICSELKTAVGKFKYVHPYPTMKEIERSMKVCRFRNLFHPKAKLRERYGMVLKLLQYLKEHHPQLVEAGE